MAEPFYGLGQTPGIPDEDPQEVARKKAMPWQKGAADSGFSRRDINAMKPQSAGFEAGASGLGNMQAQLAAQTEHQATAKDQLEELAQRMSLRNKWS